MPSFLADVVAGTAKPDDIDDYVEEWHVRDREGHRVDIFDTLHHHLGMTWEQYKRWVEHPSALDAIIAEYASQRGDNP